MALLPNRANGRILSDRIGPLGGGVGGTPAPPSPVWQNGIFTAGNNAFGWGYATEPLVSAPLGTLIEQPYTGSELLSFWEAPDDSQVIVTFSGDIVAQLTGQTFIINGATLEVLQAPAYDAVNNWTIMFLEPYWMTDGQAYVIARVAVAPSGVPVNEQLPAITGLMQQGVELTFDVGLWSGAVDLMEIRVRQVNPAATLIDWVAVDGTDTGSVDAAEGSSLILDVRCSNSSGSATASSAEFGPIAPAGDEFIAGFVFNASEAFNPTPAGSPVTYTLVAPNPSVNLYDAGVGYGFTGTLAATTTTNFASTTRADPRICGRIPTNAGVGQLGFRVDLEPGETYLVYAGHNAASNVVPNAAIYEGVNGAGGVLATFNPAAATITAAQALDAAGNVTTLSEWTEASEFGGEPIEITTTSGVVTIARTSTNGAPLINYFAFVKKVLP